MSGFDHDPLADIADLKGILRDQYDPRSILKELIQNTDAAGATSLHPGVDPGRPDAPHRLLAPLRVGLESREVWVGDPDWLPPPELGDGERGDPLPDGDGEPGDQ